MKDLDELKAEQPGQGFQFPGVFEITAMGRADADLERRVPEIIESVGVSVLAGSQRVRPSREGNYLAVSVSFTCPGSRALRCGASRRLRASDGIRWTL